MAKVHVLLNQKGGVGKSTLTVNLAAVTADVMGGDPEAPSPVAAVSVDPQGSTIWWADRLDTLPFHVSQAHDDLDGLRGLRNIPGIEHIFVDTPGWIDLSDADDPSDPLGSGASAEALRAVLESADDIIVPIEVEPMSYDPTVRTIRKVVEPRGIPFTVVINNWDPRDGAADLDETKEFLERAGEGKWRRANTVVRHYKIHVKAPAFKMTVVEYPVNRISLQAREDFYKLALELNLGAS